jgi:retron-type reverse transcriptase
MKKNNAMTQKKDLPEGDLKEVQNLLTRFLFKKAEQEAEKSMKIKGVTHQQLDKEIDELNEGSRTEYLNKIRK